MATPIRITFRENADHFAEAASQVPTENPPIISEKHQRIFFTLLIGGTLAYATIEEYLKSGRIAIPLLAAACAVLVIFFWVWFFKKIGLYPKPNFQRYEWTAKDRDQFQKSYRKRTGQDEAEIVCVFDETGFEMNAEKMGAKRYEWAAIKRVVESPKGLLIYYSRYFYFWIPRASFIAQEDYRAVIGIIEARARKFEWLDFGGLALIALGSNQGDSVKTLRDAMKRLQGLSDRAIFKSSLWQTTPVDCPPGSPPFLNAVVGLHPQGGETPESLLEKLQALEKEFGRQPKKVLNEARPLDLDLIGYGSEMRDTPALVLPHPRAAQRRFVLEPLSEIAPDLILQGQTRTVAELLAALPVDAGMRRMVG